MGPYLVSWKRYTVSENKIDFLGYLCYNSTNDSELGQIPDEHIPQDPRPSGHQDRPQSLGRDRSPEVGLHWIRCCQEGRVLDPPPGSTLKATPGAWSGPVETGMGLFWGGLAASERIDSKHQARLYMGRTDSATPIRDRCLRARPR